MVRRLFYGDNLDVLRSESVANSSFDLCYVDPPFNSKRSYNQIYNNLGQEDRAQAQAFLDTWTWTTKVSEEYEEIINNQGRRFHPKTVDLIRGLSVVLDKGSLLAYLVSMTTRINEIHRVLKPTGSFYLHCDPTASHYLKVVLDSIFCSRGGEFQNEIVWRRTGAHGARTRFGPIHDVLLFYTKSQEHIFTRVLRPYMKGHVESRYTLEGDRLKFTSGGNVLTGPDRTKGPSGQPWKGFDPSAKNRHWAIPGFLAEQMPEGFEKLDVIQKLDALFDAGLIEIGEDTAWPVPVRFLDPEASGQPLQDIWAFQPYTEGTVYGTKEGIDADVKWIGPTNSSRSGYQTEKPEGLLERVIRSSCPEGGAVLDAFCGCGTTVRVAERLGLDWTGIDITYQSIAHILKSVEDRFGPAVKDAVELNGVPRDLESAVALAHKKDDRVRKEFEKWAVLTYTSNRAAINEKKGADAGIDGTAYFMEDRDSTAKVVLQVKSGGVQRRDISALHGDMLGANAVAAVLITLEEPTRVMKKAAKGIGVYRHELTGKAFDILQIVTVEEILSGVRLDLPWDLEVLKKARRSKNDKQISLI